MDVDAVLGGLYELIAPHLTEKQRRLLAGAAARALGRGGGARMARISGLSRPTVYAGARELAAPPDPRGRVRRPGGRPKRLADVGELVFGVVQVRGDQATGLDGYLADGERAAGLVTGDLEGDVHAAVRDLLAVVAWDRVPCRCCRCCIHRGLLSGCRLPAGRVASSLTALGGLLGCDDASWRVWS